MRNIAHRGGWVSLRLPTELAQSGSACCTIENSELDRTCLHSHTLNRVRMRSLLCR